MIHQLLFLWMVFPVILGYPASFELQVAVTNITKEKGTLNVCIYQNEESFLKNPLECNQEQVEKTGSVTVTFSGLSEGSYAVYVFQDLNKNDSLDRNFFRVPKEPYGFSNNPAIKFGPPSFSEARFSVPSIQELNIIMK